MAGPPGVDTGPLTLILACPKCGAPFEADDETAGLRCPHCGSLLRLSAPGRQEVYVADGFLAGAADVQDLLLSYRLESARAEILASLREGDDVPQLLEEALVEARLRAVEAELRAAVRVAEAHRIHVPYWHITGRIVQGILGRKGDGPKGVRLRAFAVEHTVPAYDVERANLRDRGLRLARTRVRPLTAARAAELRAFLPWRAVAEQSYREIDRWKGQDLDQSLEPVAKHSRFLQGTRLLVYRPYWLARVREAGAESWLLADGQFQTIAGYPSEDEARELRGQGAGDPLATASEGFRRVEVVASRCPDCGFEAELAHGEHIAVCTNCHLALQPEPQGARIAPYDHARAGEVRLDGDYLPFWRYGVALDIPQLWVPAFRLLGTEQGDETLRALVEWIHAHPPDAVPGKVPLGGRPTAWGVTVPEPEARELLPFVRLGLHDKKTAARLNARSWKAAGEADLSPASPRLVLVPFDREGDSLVFVGNGPRVPLLLLRGGPELEAQRATVHRARATEPPRFPRLSY
jgi:DNA-directed RNA polymerase subunit RPC12/RpoP